MQTLTCMEEEHVHGDDCFDPEDGTLICEKFEHTHDENCYTTEYELTCGLEEGELVEQVVEPTQSAELAAMAVAEPVALEPTVDTVEPIYHHHTDACYEEVLTCPLPEHHHTVACLSDTSADVETPEEWQAANDKAVMTGNWDEDLLSVAKTQLGYEQSEKNFEIDPADGVTLRYYSRYGQSYGNPYGEWDVMFLSYCLKYAGIPQSAIPQEASVLSLRSSMSDMDWLLDGEDGSAANVGDIVIYNKYVTRTVAVDSSADGAADDLDDQFSMDAEGENGAELETSGASALDAAPAADSVITPDLPDTANPEQPAAKPVDSTGTSASGADTLIPSVVSPAAEPQTTTVTDAQPVETVGIVSSVDSDADTLTVISGDVDGKVAEVTLSSAEVLAVVDVAAAQYADEMLSSAVDGALRAPDMLMLTGEGSGTLTSVQYVAYFDETPEGSNKGGITGITIKKGNQTLDPGTTAIDLTDGEKLKLTYFFEIPENALSGLSTRTLTYKLPDGITLSEKKPFDLINKSDHNNVVGTGEVDTDGTVRLTFYDSFAITKPFTGQFDFEAEASTVGGAESTKISFPTGLDLLVKLPRDLAIEKTGATPVVENGSTYIDYTVTVSSKDGWSKPIEILDELQNTSTFAGEYVQTSFNLVKFDTSNNVTTVTSYNNNFTTSAGGNPTFNITNLGVLKAGESYKLTYRVKITKNIATGNGYVEFYNKVRSNKEEKWWTTKFDSRIWKSGTYDPDTNKITWTVTVKNPYGQNLKDSAVVDDITTADALIEGNITLTETVDKNGSTVNKDIATFAPDTNGKGFKYTFGDAYGKEYKFTYVTSVPKSSDGTQVKVHNDSTFTTGGKDYTTGTDVYSYDRSWNFNKSTTQSSLTSTGTENKYTAGWKLSSAVPNSWTTYDFVDQIRVPTHGKHYGIASELNAAILGSLKFTTVDGTGTPLSAADAGITVTIDYYTDSFDNASDADKHTKIDAANSTAEIHTFIIHLTNNKSYTGSPVKSMEIGGYSTYVDTTDVPAGAEVMFYNNYTSYYYKKNSLKTGLTKGVSTNDSGTDGYYGNRSDNYKPTATGTYSTGMEVYYELVLDVSSWDKFPEDGTVTVTDTLPDGLTFKDGSAKGFFGWSNWCQQHSTGWELDFNNNKANFEATCEGQTITFKFKNLDKAQFELEKSEGSRLTNLLVRYTATVTDTKWENPKTVTESYTNKAKWDGKDANATITLNRNLEYLTKAATFEAKTGELVVHYSLDINPAWDDLLPGGDTVILTDTLAVQDKFVTAHLDMDSVKLYDYPYKAGDTPLATTSYGMVYKRTTDSSTGYDTHTMVFTLDDSHGYVLKYDYVVDSNADVKLSNKAVLTGDHEAEWNEIVTGFDASGFVSQSKFTLYKVDSLNLLTRLQGAKFNLSYYDGTAKTYKDHPEQATHITDAKGEIVLYLGDNKKDDPSGGHFTIEPDTLYKLVETAAPAGYKKGTEDETTVYFIFADTGKSATATWTATAIPDGLHQSDSNVVICTSGQQKNYAVENTRTWLTIQKFWQDKDGFTLPEANTPDTDVTVELYRYAKSGGSKDSAEHVADFILNKTNSWTYVYKNVEKDYYYFIKEASTGNKYEVTYSDSNTTGVENGGLLTLTNKEIVGYELPSTGGTGTLPYTAVGGTMMLTALAYSFIHRKRRREGRADD